MCGALCDLRPLPGMVWGARGACTMPARPCAYEEGVLPRGECVRRLRATSNYLQAVVHEHETTRKASMYHICMYLWSFTVVTITHVLIRSLALASTACSNPARRKRCIERFTVVCVCALSTFCSE
jgi:hypothetical protein